MKTKFKWYKTKQGTWLTQWCGDYRGCVCTCGHQFSPIIEQVPQRPGYVDSWKLDFVCFALKDAKRQVENLMLFKGDNDDE